MRWRWLGEKAAAWFCEWLAGLGVRTPGPGFLLHVQETHLLELLHTRSRPITQVLYYTVNLDLVSIKYKSHIGHT